MNERQQIVPIGGLVATVALAAYMVVQLHAQATIPARDFSNAAVAEVHDTQGQVFLRGQFVPVPEEDEDIERKARLESAGIDADATGEAEVEFSKEDPAQQEVEFSVRNLQPGMALTFVIDGHVVGQAIVDPQGRAEIEVDIAASGAAASRRPDRSPTH